MWVPYSNHSRIENEGNHMVCPSVSLDISEEGNTYSFEKKKKHKKKTDVLWRDAVLSVNNSCTLHNSVTVEDIFMLFYRNMY